MQNVQMQHGVDWSIVHNNDLYCVELWGYQKVCNNLKINHINNIRSCPYWYNNTPLYMNVFFEYLHVQFFVWSAINRNFTSTDYQPNYHYIVSTETVWQYHYNPSGILLNGNIIHIWHGRTKGQGKLSYHCNYLLSGYFSTFQKA